MQSHYFVLSRKYRPKSLNDLIGQDVLSESLRKSIDNKRIPHAFLFHGIRGIGKTTTARILARCLNCLGEDGNTHTTSTPCGVCKSCIAMDADSHMDVMEIDAASRTGVDDIREIIDASQYMPIQGRYKIFIIDEVHMLSKSAFNALLKTLEEPPSHVKFIFATTEMNKIPETILSRCMTFNLKPVLEDVISDHLIKISSNEGFVLDQEAALEISVESEGSVRDALSVLEQAMMLSLESKQISKESVISMLGGAKQSDIDSLLSMILNADVENSLITSEKLMQTGTDPFVLYKNLQNSLYKIITDEVKNKTNKYSLSNLLYIWQIFLNQNKNMKQASFPSQVFNATVIIMALTASFPSIESLMINEENINHNTKELSTDKNKFTSKIEDIIGKKIEIQKDNTKIIDDILKKFSGSTATEIE